MAILIMSKLADTCADVMECVRAHEERWKDRIHVHGIDKLVHAHFEKYAKDYAIERDKEHALKELAASALYALCELTKGRE